MALKLKDSLARHLAVAHRVVEVIVLRGCGGEVYTVEIGTALHRKTGPAYGAKVTQLSPSERHIAVCLGPTAEEVFDQAQQYIADTLAPPRRMARGRVA